MLVSVLLFHVLCKASRWEVEHFLFAKNRFQDENRIKKICVSVCPAFICSCYYWFDSQLRNLLQGSLGTPELVKYHSGCAKDIARSPGLCLIQRILVILWNVLSFSFACDVRTHALYQQWVSCKNNSPRDWAAEVHVQMYESVQWGKAELSHMPFIRAIHLGHMFWPQQLHLFNHNKWVHV